MIRLGVVFLTARRVCSRSILPSQHFGALRRNASLITPFRQGSYFALSNHPHQDLLAAPTDKERSELAKKKIDNLNEVERKLLEEVKLQHQVALVRGEEVPETLSNYDLLMLLTMSSNHRSRYMRYLWGVEVKKKKQKEKRGKTLVKVGSTESKEPVLTKDSSNSHSCTDSADASKAENSSGAEDGADWRRMCEHLYMRIYGSKVYAKLQNKQLTQMRFGIPLVFDCSYSPYMRPQDAVNMVEQIQHSYSANRAHRSGFNFIFCGMERKSAQERLFERMFSRNIDDIPFEIYEQSYLEALCGAQSKSTVLDFVNSPSSRGASHSDATSSWLNQPRRFDKQQFVYLSPHARNDMERFDPNSVYILGAFVNKVTDEPLSLAKARRDGIRCERLPLDRYVTWAKGKKALTLDCVVRILLHLSESPENHTAFREAFLKHLPTRHLRASNESDDGIFEADSRDDVASQSNQKRSLWSETVDQNRTRYIKGPKARRQFGDANRRDARFNEGGRWDNGRTQNLNQSSYRVGEEFSRPMRTRIPDRSGNNNP